MSYEVKGTILGFEKTLKVDINNIDDLFSTLIDTDNKNISFTLVNPYSLREYSFDLPSNIKSLLDIHKDSKVKVYNVTIIQKPLENSYINFLAPIIVNEDNKTIGQAILNRDAHPDFGMTEKLSSFITK